jgi:hypothetical protein
MTEPALQPPTAPAPHQLDTRIKYLIAVIALCATVIGSVLGAGAAIYSANLNSQTQIKIAEHNTSKTQIQAVFSSFLSDQSTFEVDDDKFGNSMIPHPTGSSSLPVLQEPSPRELRDAVLSDQGKLNYDAQLIEILVGKTQVSSYAAVVLDADRAIVDYDVSAFQSLAASIEPIPDFSRPRPVVTQMYSKLEDSLNSLRLEMAAALAIQ